MSAACSLLAGPPQIYNLAHVSQRLSGETVAWVDVQCACQVTAVTAGRLHRSRILAPPQSDAARTLASREASRWRYRSLPSRKARTTHMKRSAAGSVAARPRPRRHGRDPARRAGRARLPVQPLGPGDRPGQSLRERHGRGRARRAVPRGHERNDQRHPLLQVGRQRRRARGQPLDEHGRAARHRDLRGRDRFGLAAGAARRARRRRGEHAVRRLVPHAGRTLLVRRRVLRAPIARTGRSSRPRAPPPAATASLPTAPASAFPGNSFNATNYWVDVVFEDGAPDPNPPTVVSTTPAAGATGVGVTRRRARRLLEGDGRRQHRRHHVRAARRGRQRSCPPP